MDLFGNAIQKGQVESTFLKDVLSGPHVLNPFNLIHNLDGVYGENAVVASAFVRTNDQVVTQILPELSRSVYESVEAVVIKDTFPLSYGHSMCVPLRPVLSFNSYFHENEISLSQYIEMLNNISTYLSRQAMLAGMSSRQTIFFEHGGGTLDRSLETYSACGTGVELCTTTTHAHLHAVPLVDTDQVSLETILEMVKEVMGNSFGELVPLIRYENHLQSNLEGASYLSLTLATDGIKHENILIVPDTRRFGLIPSQFWRKVIWQILKGQFAIDLSDYKKLSARTLGDLRSEKTIDLLRSIHNRFWLNLEI